MLDSFRNLLQLVLAKGFLTNPATAGVESPVCPPHHEKLVLKKPYMPAREPHNFPPKKASPSRCLRRRSAAREFRRLLRVPPIKRRVTVPSTWFAPPEAGEVGGLFERRRHQDHVRMPRKKATTTRSAQGFSTRLRGGGDLRVCFSVSMGGFSGMLWGDIGITPSECDVPG